MTPVKVAAVEDADAEKDAEKAVEKVVAVVDSMIGSDVPTVMIVRATPV